MLSAGIFLPSPSSGADEQSLAKSVLSNGADLAAAPFRVRSDDWPWIVSIGGLLGGSFAADRTVRDTLEPHHGSQAAHDLKLYSDVMMGAGPAMGFYYLWDGARGGHARSRWMARLTWESLLWSSVGIGAGKLVFGRQRPEDERDPFVFKPFSGGGSFPSGHTTYAFTAATLAAEEYDSLSIQIPAYMAAGAVGFARLYANKHWLSDVVAGAMLGTAIPHTLRKRLKNKRQSASTSAWIVSGDRVIWVKRF